MHVYKFFNPGPYGSFEEGILLCTTDGKTRIVIQDTGVFQATEDMTFNIVSGNDAANPMSFSHAMVDILGNAIAGNDDLAKKVLGMVHPDLLPPRPKFELGQEVRAKLFNMVITGPIVKISTFETSLGTQFRYDVAIPTAAGYSEDCVCPWEDSLLELNPIEQHNQKTSA